MNKTNFEEKELNFEQKVKNIIDQLKAVSTEQGLSNTGYEYKIISELFTYKFLNDKVMYFLKEYCNENKKSINYLSEVKISLGDSSNENDIDEENEKRTEEYNLFLRRYKGKIPVIEREYLLCNLYNFLKGDNASTLLNSAFDAINSNKKNKHYIIKTSKGKNHYLFDSLNSYINDDTKTNEIAKKSISILNDTSFEEVFENNGGNDFFAAIFEYLIKDYNKDSGKYAEYYTPSFAGDIISEILVDENETPKGKEIYDPSAGSGTLLMSLSNSLKGNCTIYSQDISQKSTNFLRLNLILNGLEGSLPNVSEGDTLISPFHTNEDGTLRKFDYIISNPPFKVDFSNTRKTLENDFYDRFGCGIPIIPKTRKDSMSIYLMFIQHILASLKDDGKAAIVLPTGFCTAQSKIEKEIREKLIKENILSAVVDMPSNIFANTGTSVSILFIDKSRKDDKNVILVDATKLGKKVKTESGQKTELKPEEQQEIIDITKARENVEDKAIVVSNERIKENGYSFKAGQYFEHKIEKLDVDFDARMKELSIELPELFSKSNKLQTEITNILGGLGYGKVEDN